MIPLAIFVAVAALVLSLMRLLPDIPTPDAIDGPFSAVFAHAASLNEVLPVAEMISVLGGFVAVVAGLQAYTAARKLISHFTGGGGA